MKATHALLISIRPRFVAAIFAGTKTVELRRVKPRLQPGDLVIIYASGKTKGIVGAFEVSGVTIASPGVIWRRHNGGSGLSKAEYDNYFAGTNVGYAIQVGRTWKLPSPILLGTLRKRRSGFRPPQSYHYWPIEEIFRVGGGSLSSELGRHRDLEARI